VSETQRIVVDVREVAPAQRHARILQTFESLPEGGEMVLVVDHDPKPLLYQFQAERAGCYDWSALEEGPNVWRILIARHPASDLKARSAAAYLAWDHDRLDALLAGYHDALIAGRVAEAAPRFAEFSTGLRRHIRMEEKVLFPAFERATEAGEQGPTAVMRQEHRIIEGILERMAASLVDPRGSGEVRESLRCELLHVLGEHNAKEEHIVYPLTDRHHVAADRESLIRKMQAI